MTVPEGTALIDADTDLLQPVRRATDNLVVDVREIRSSPYHEISHLLDLTRLSIEHRIIALALQSFEPHTPKYAFGDYAQAFNISKIIALIPLYARELLVTFKDTDIYIIVFRSVLHEEVQHSTEKRQFLADVDSDSHIEANISGGLLKYWFGTPDNVHGQNLATCWWESKKHAQVGGGGNAHKLGMEAVKTWFKRWHVEEYMLEIRHSGNEYTLLKV